MRWRLQHVASVLVLAAFAPWASAAEIKVRENPVPANTYAAVALTGTEPGDNVAWDVYPEPTVIDDWGDGRLTFNGPTGTKYRVTADVVNFDKKTRKKYRVDVTIGLAPLPPPPAPDPKPKPDPDPKPPPGPAPDPVLTAALKAALAKDVAVANGTKAKAADLAIVLDTGASLLDLNDPAIAPKTVGELYTKMVLGSVAKGVPRPPYLKETRAVIDANLPLLNGETMLTPAIKADFQAKYRAVAAALTEASK